RLARLEAPARANPATTPAQGRGGRPAGAHPATAGTVSVGTVSAGTASPSTGRLLSRSELVETAGLTDALLTELEAFGLLRRIGRYYGPDALVVARTAVTLTAYGMEARHLRAVRAAAERETTMIESLVAPIQRQRGAGAR